MYTIYYYYVEHTMSVEKRCTNSTPTVSATSSSCCTPTAGGSTINSSSFLTPPSSSSRGRDKKSITDQQSLYQQHIISTSYHGHSTKQVKLFVSFKLLQSNLIVIISHLFYVSLKKLKKKKTLLSFRKLIIV